MTKSLPDGRRGAELEMALDLIAWVGSRRRPFTVRELRGALGLHRRTAWRWLRAMEAMGVVECVAEGSFGGYGGGATPSQFRARLRVEKVPVA